MNRNVPRVASATVVMILGCVASTGCTSVVRKHAYDFKTTALFQKPCELPPAPESQRLETASVAPVQAALKDEPAPPAPIADPGPSRRVQTDAACNSAYLIGMAEKFMTIKENDDATGVAGDTITDVRRKGFSIFVDADQTIRRQNTKPLYGADALAAVGMGVSPPPLQRPEDVRAYAEYMGQHYAEEYYERDMTNVTDRFCLNRRESIELGDDRTFTILWRNGHVIKRVIKGGPVNNPKEERGFLVCPSKFIHDTVTGRASSALGALKY